MQYVCFKSSISSTKSISTGGPQGCVLSAGLFILYTSDKGISANNCFIVKYADDTVIVGLLDDNPENEEKYRSEIESFVKWCDENYLNLNVKKTKEMVIDFRKKKSDLTPIVINGENVEFAENYKYLGNIINDKLSSSDHIVKVAKKANQRMYFVRKLTKFGVNKKILSLFYKSTVESLINFCIVCWHGNSCDKDKKYVKKVIKTAKRLGCDTTLLDDLYKAAIKNKCSKIMKDSSHPLHCHFNYPISGLRLNSMYARTLRFKTSFVPSAIRFYNNSHL